MCRAAWANVGRHPQGLCLVLLAIVLQLERGSRIQARREVAHEEKQVEGARAIRTILLDSDAVGGDEREGLAQLEVAIELHAAHTTYMQCAPQPLPRV